jgi:hypothetical protein
LQHAAASSELEEADREHFRQYREENRGNLFYEPGETSKTGLCLKRQAPLVLVRGDHREWGLEDGGETPELRQESGGSFLTEPDRSIAGCELEKSRSESILLIPVRDRVNPRLLVGLLRMVSTTRSVSQETISEISHFASALSIRLSNLLMGRIQRQAGQRLVRDLAELGSEKERWRRAARIVAEALEADAVTVFVRRQDDLFRSTRDYSFLNLPQIERDQDDDKVEAQKQHYEEFLQLLPGQVYHAGIGRTGWGIQHRRILNLKNLVDPGAQARHGIRTLTDATGAACEIEQPGPFLACPIFTGVEEDSSVQAVIRALRWKWTPRGPFSRAHETIVQTCATILSALPSVLPPPAMEVVISYHHRYKDWREELCRFLEALDFRPLVLERLDPPDKWPELLRRAEGGIAVATPDVSRDARKEISGNVATEIQNFLTAFPDRTLVLKERSVDLPAMTLVSGVETIDFREDFGIASCFLELACRLQDWKRGG